MTDRPILFSAPMVRAIIAGEKTKTRRRLNHGAHYPNNCVIHEGMAILRNTHTGMRQDVPLPCKVGDGLWVREAWGTLIDHDALPGSKLPEAFGDAGIRAGDIRYNATCAPGALPNGDGIYGRYRPARFMPRWASRLTLVVTSVQVERLQDITEAEAEAEGCVWDSADGHDVWYVPGAKMERNGATAVECFSLLWNSINGPGAWEANPWVVAIGFEVAA